MPESTKISFKGWQVSQNTIEINNLSVVKEDK
jgi:hypothetical protein